MFNKKEKFKKPGKVYEKYLQHTHTFNEEFVSRKIYSSQNLPSERLPIK